MRFALLPSLLLSSLVAAQSFQIDQPVGGDNFGGGSTGQTFTPAIGITPDASMFSALPLTEITLYQGNGGANAPSATTYLNIYDGDPNAAGTFVGSSSNSVDTNSPVFHTAMTWSFSQLSLSTTREYWAVMSSTNVAGNLDVGCSLENYPRATPNPYTGGSGLVAGAVKHSADNDCKFQIRFDFGAPAPTLFTIDQPGGGDNFGNLCRGQSFTPGIGVTPDASAYSTLPLTHITFYQGNSGASTASATTYLNIYDGDPNAGGMFIGSSLNFNDTNNPVYHTPMTWYFDHLMLSTTVKYWAIMSSTNAAGTLDVGCSLENYPRATPNPYSGGSGIVGSWVEHSGLNDLKFQIQFDLSAYGALWTVGYGCPRSNGVVVDLRSQGGAEPVVGQSLTIEVFRAPANELISVLALGATDLGGVDLVFFGMPGCPMHVDGSLLLMASTDAAGVGAATLSVPSSPALIGGALYAQPFVADAAANSFGAVMGNAKRVQIGD